MRRGRYTREEDAKTRHEHIDTSAEFTGHPPTFPDIAILREREIERKKEREREGGKQERDKDKARLERVVDRRAEKVPLIKVKKGTSGYITSQSRTVPIT
jgi:hypothetical protein